MNRICVPVCMLLMQTIGCLFDSVAQEPSLGVTAYVRQQDKSANGRIAQWLTETEDLRTWFSAPDTLEKRIADSIVVFDYGSASKVIEVRIGANSTVQDVLDRTFVKTWDGYPQLKLIQRNSILQSPLRAAERTDEGVEAFRKLKVVPGDCLVRIMQS